jgi:ABC-type antimicrobial peptide transport system permease subunit
MIVREGMRLTGVGLAIGLLLAAAATRLLSRFLFGISPLDAATFVLMSVTFGVVALIASYLPARSAARANPMMVLREE